MRAGGVISLLGGSIGIVSVFLWAANLAAQAPEAFFSSGVIATFASFGGLALGLIGIGIALLGLPD